jgi:nicotinamidase-related amidase
MKRFLTVMTLATICGFSSNGFTAVQAGPGPDSGVQLPEIPAAVPVTLDAQKTAFLVLDLVDAICTPRPGCVASVPGVAGLLAKARAANVFVVYSTGRNPAAILAPVAPLGDEPIVRSSADKFFQTDLEQILTGSGVDTLVLVGVAANGAPMYTAFGANSRGYTVVVAEDGISSGNDFDVWLARYQLLNEPGYANPTNAPLQPNAVTLSRTDLITFR